MTRSTGIGHFRHVSCFMPHGPKHGACGSHSQAAAILRTRDLRCRVLLGWTRDALLQWQWQKLW